MKISFIILFIKHVLYFAFYSARGKTDVLVMGTTLPTVAEELLKEITRVFHETLHGM